MQVKIGTSKSVNTAFVFSWQSDAGLEEDGLRGICHKLPCPCCDCNLIEIFVDRILTPWHKPLFGDEEFCIIETAIQLSVILIHELTHWAGEGEDPARRAEEMVEDYVLNGALSELPTMQPINETGYIENAVNR